MQPHAGLIGPKVGEGIEQFLQGPRLERPAYAQRALLRKLDRPIVCWSELHAISLKTIVNDANQSAVAPILAKHAGGANLPQWFWEYGSRVGARPR